MWSIVVVWIARRPRRNIVQTRLLPIRPHYFDELSGLEHLSALGGLEYMGGAVVSVFLDGL